MQEFKPRFQDIVKEKVQKPYNDQEIWKKWELNRENIKQKGHLKVFLDYCKQKEMEHSENLKKIEEQNDEIQKIRREILIKKGYNDPSELRTINYSLVEESSPKYTIKGKIEHKIVNYEDFGKILLNENEDIINEIKDDQLNRPLPDFNYIRPKLPSIIFSKAERFQKSKEYEGSTYLFKDGVFAPKTQEDFFLK